MNKNELKIAELGAFVMGAIAGFCDRVIQRHECEHCPLRFIDGNCVFASGLEPVTWLTPDRSDFSERLLQVSDLRDLFRE